MVLRRSASSGEGGVCSPCKFKFSAHVLMSSLAELAKLVSSVQVKSCILKTKFTGLPNTYQNATSEHDLFLFTCICAGCSQHAPSYAMHSTQDI